MGIETSTVSAFIFFPDAALTTALIYYKIERDDESIELMNNIHIIAWIENDAVV